VAPWEDREKPFKKVLMNNSETLTPKMAAFAGFVASGKSLVDAYISAYDWKGKSRAAARNESARLAAVPKIKERIEALKADSIIARKAQEEISKTWILDRLKDEAVDDENASSVRVRALEILAKSQGLFSDSTSVTIENRSSAEVESELKQKLSALLGETEAITLVK